MSLDLILTGCPELRCAGHETGRVCGMMWALWGITARAVDWGPSYTPFLHCSSSGGHAPMWNY